MGADIRVLCVDDDPSVVKLLSSILDDESGLAALTETDPEEALARYDAERVDCVVSDYHMPGMDGLDLLAALREREPEVPFILFTGKGNEDVASEAVSAGVTDYIQKATGMQEFELLVNRIRNAVKHRRARVNYHEVFDAVDDALLVVDPETGALVDVNRAACDLWEYSEQRLLELGPSDLGADSDDGGSARLQNVPDDDSDRFDWRCRRADGDTFSASVSVRSAVIEGEQRTLAVVRDVTRRRKRERALAALLDGTEDLVAAETRDGVVETATEIAAKELAVDPATVEARVDPGTARAERSRVSDGVIGTSTGSDSPGRPADGDAEPSLSLVADSVERYERDLIQLLEKTATVAYARVSKEELLRERERTLERQRSELARLNRFNEVIREINRTLVRATTRDEVERLVCEQFVAAEPHRFAWIGSPDYGAEEVVPRAWAGIDAGYLQESSFPIAGDGPLNGAVETAVVDHEVGLVEDLSSGADAAEHERRFRSVAVIPVVYGNVLYDVLAVYADESHTFDEVAALAELGETVGYAMHNVEQRRTRVGDTVVELSFALRSDASVLVAISDRLSTRVELKGTRVETDGTWRLFLATACAAETSTLVDAHERILDASTVTTEGDLHDVVVGESAFRELLGEYRATVETAVAEGGEENVVVELSGGGDVRTFVERFADEYGAELIARRERTPGTRDEEHLFADLPALLTARQYEVLLTAHHAGFFEWPREQSGEEVAEGLGISQPTFHEHLRASQRTLLSELLDDEST